MPRKTELMVEFEKQTGKNAIWRGKITKQFKDWKINSLFKKDPIDKERLTKTERKEFEVCKLTKKSLEESERELDEAEEQLEKLEDKRDSLIDRIKTLLTNTRADTPKIKNLVQQADNKDYDVGGWMRKIEQIEEEIEGLEKISKRCKKKKKRWRKAQKQYKKARKKEVISTHTLTLSDGYYMVSDIDAELEKEYKNLDKEIEKIEKDVERLRREIYDNLLEIEQSDEIREKYIKATKKLWKRLIDFNTKTYEAPYWRRYYDQSLQIQDDFKKICENLNLSINDMRD
jgi:DNA repair exonuclease SbcCD ATPase subunit